MEKINSKHEESINKPNFEIKRAEKEENSEPKKESIRSEPLNELIKKPVLDPI